MFVIILWKNRVLLKISLTLFTFIFYYWRTLHHPSTNTLRSVKLSISRKRELKIYIFRICYIKKGIWLIIIDSPAWKISRTIESYIKIYELWRISYVFPTAREERIIAIDRCKISPGCRSGIGIASWVKSSYRIGIRHANTSGLYTCPAGNSSHSTVILRLACDRHSNDTTSHRASRPFFPIFQSLPLQDQRMHERKAVGMKPFLNVRKLGARQQNIKLIAGLRAC